MKKILFTLLCAMFANMAVNAQTITAAEVPSAIKKAVLLKYPKAAGVQWEKQQANYEAQFMLGNSWTTALYSATAEWLQTASFLESAALPANIATLVKKELPGAEILSVTALDKPREGKTFAVQAATELDTYDFVYKADGTLASKTKVVYELEAEEAVSN